MSTTTTPTVSALRAMSKPELIAFGNGYCLFEHLDTTEVEAMTKTALINEVRGAFARIEVEQEHVAAATDTVAKSVAEVIGLDAAPAKRTRGRKAAAAEVPAEAVTTTTVEDDRALVAARRKLEAASTAHVDAVSAERKARAARTRAMVAMKEAGASYAQVAEVVGMTPMSARAAILGGAK